MLELDSSDKPILMMGDERSESRLYLGFIEPDTASPEWDDWALSFRGAMSEIPAAGIGMVKVENGALEGRLSVSGKRIQSEGPAEPEVRWSGWGGILARIIGVNESKRLMNSDEPDELPLRASIEGRQVGGMDPERPAIGAR